MGRLLSRLHKHLIEETTPRWLTYLAILGGVLGVLSSLWLYQHQLVNDLIVSEVQAFEESGAGLLAAYESFDSHIVAHGNVDEPSRSALVENLAQQFVRVDGFKRFVDERGHAEIEAYKTDLVNLKDAVRGVTDRGNMKDAYQRFAELMDRHLTLTEILRRRAGTDGSPA